MADIWNTYGKFRAKLQLDTDTADETFISPDELVGLTNEGIQEAESEIHTLDEEYFLAEATITLANGTSEYDLPTDIFGQKIRGITFHNGSIIYPVKRVRRLHKFFEVELVRQFGSQENYRYLLKNQSATAGLKLVLLPQSRDVGAFLFMWYIREANRIPLVSAGSQAASDATVIDIPEFVPFVFDFVKLKIMQKEKDPGISEQAAILANQRKMMVDTLTNRVPDDDDNITMDLTHYEEHA